MKNYADKAQENKSQSVASGVNAIQKEKQQKNITKGGEGYKPGKIGLKSEKNFYSAATGDKSETWDKLKTQIKRTELHDWQATV